MTLTKLSKDISELNLSHLTQNQDHSLPKYITTNTCALRPPVIYHFQVYKSISKPISDSFPVAVIQNLTNSIYRRFIDMQARQ
jgi:hypothetical protein